MVLIEREYKGGNDLIRENILRIFLIPWGIKYSSFGYIKMGISEANKNDTGPYIFIIYNKDDRNVCWNDAHNVTG